MFKPIAAFAAAGAIVGGITLAPNVVGAQEADEAPAPTEESERPHRHFGPKLGLRDLDVDREAIRDDIEAGSTLGEALESQGIDLDELRANAAELLAERLADAVEDGRLTQEEADQKAAELEARIDERLESSELGRGHRHGHGHRGFGGLRQFFGDADIDKDAVREALQGGASLQDALAEQGLDLEQLRADALEAAQERLDEAVAAGDIDAERAAQIQERLDAVGAGDFDFGGFGERGFGGFGERGFGGFGERGFGERGFGEDGFGPFGAESADTPA